MKSSTSNYLFGILLLGLLALPVFVSAWFPGDPIVPCGRTSTGTSGSGGSLPCEFDDLVTLAENIMGFLTFISIPIAALLFAYAGFLLIKPGAAESERKKAKAIFSSTIIGIAIMLGAYVAVYTIASALVDEKYYDPLLNDSSK